MMMTSTEEEDDDDHEVCQNSKHHPLQKMSLFAHPPAREIARLCESK